MVKLLNKYQEDIPQIERELILSSILKCRRQDLYLEDKGVGRDIEILYSSLIKRRVYGEPLQYIINSAEFMGRDFYVDKSVFIPRPETELLVNEILHTCDLRPETCILDLCTGSGNIAISLALSMPEATIYATDISYDALKIAYRNALIHGASNNLIFYQGDLFQALPIDKNIFFDIIVCNPPYVKKEDIDSLQSEVRFEPRIALGGGEDGLGYYRALSSKAPDFLKDKGSLALELGIGQYKHMSEIFSSSRYKIRKTIKDHEDIERIIWIDLL
ncbi:MAG: peptide chain release factor N(5)-glutamine methyltransferase [Candidatus Omnitrophota bacterium]